MRYLLALLATVSFGGPVTISGDGWTITADSPVLEVRHEKLGVVVKDMRLGLAAWTAEKKSEGRLEIRSTEPRTGWVIELRPEAVQISSTSYQAAVSGTVPAGPGRVVARLRDPQGPPVDWVGTNEVEGSYGGSETHNVSNLPRRNAECMYFSLGQVSGRGFHELFDRPSGAAISFPETARLERNPANPDLLDLHMPVAGNALVRILPDYYTKTLGLPFYTPFDDSRFRSAPMVWSSWTSYYAAVREEHITRNADWLAANLKPYGFEYVQLDDGYDRAPDGSHTWIGQWDKEKFPHGPKWLADYIRAKGLRAGLWLVPNAYAGAVKEHPEWYLRDREGKFILDYQTPSLDSSNPRVIGFLRHLFETLDGWGFDYYKFDGEHALPRYAPPVDKSKLYDHKTDPVAVYRERLRVIREVLGPDRFIEGCPAGTPLNGIGFMNSYFNGHDLYNSWQGMYALFSSINANAFLNHLTVYLMPGEGLELGLPMSVEEAARKRPPQVVATARTREDPLAGFGVNEVEARTLVTYIALTGVAYPLASVMPELPAERVKLLQQTMPTLPILPVDLFSRGTDMQWNIFKFTQPDFYVHNYPEILDLKVRAVPGAYDVAGFTNWRSQPVTRRIDLEEKLGLDGQASYVAFDFWKQKPLGVVKGNLELRIEPHETRVVQIYPLLPRPQLVGGSRHISGVVSLKEVTWNGAARKLRGVSETVPGDEYTLWFHVPGGFQPGSVRVTAGGKEVAVQQKREEAALALTWKGQAEPVSWEIAF